jgi:ABC-type multidrug transport system ATPase subunit
MRDRDVVVEAQGLSKRYDAFEAVAGIDFGVRRGECFGFLGPNGAGKTTTMRMVQAVSLPSAGRLRVLRSRSTRDGKRIPRANRRLPAARQPRSRPVRS